MRTALPSVTAALAILACSPRAKNATTDTAVAPATPSRPAAAATKPSTDPSFHPAWSKNAVIYEVNVRQYTPEGTLSALRSHIPRLKALGVDILWLMPVQPIGMKNRKGNLGSYYAISDYTAVNRELGTPGDFKAVVDAAHSQGLKVILDWVANHTAYDHVDDRRADDDPGRLRHGHEWQDDHGAAHRAHLPAHRQDGWLHDDGRRLPQQPARHRRRHEPEDVDA